MSRLRSSHLGSSRPNPLSAQAGDARQRDKAAASSNAHHALRSPHRIPAERWQLDRLATHTLTDYVTAIAWSPTGQAIALVSAAGECWWQPVSTQGAFIAGQALQTASGTALNAIGFSADGRWLAAAGQEGQVRLWSCANGITAVGSVGGSAQGPVWIDHLAWHPQRPWLAVAIARQVLIWDAAQQAPVTTLNFAESSVLDLAWHPNGSMIAIGGSGAVRIWACADWRENCSDPQPVETIQLPGPSLSIAWSPEGRYLASGNLDRTLTLCEWGHSPPWLMQGFPGKVRQVLWSPPIPSEINPAPKADDWGCIAVCFDGVALWSRLGSQSDQWHCQVMDDRHNDTVRTLAIQPGSSMVVSGDLSGATYLWDLERRHDPLPVKAGGSSSGQGATSAIAWHPHQSWFVTGNTHGAVHLWRFQITQRGFGRATRTR